MGLRVCCAMLLAALSAGCSISFPIAGLSSKAEDELTLTTSSVATPLPSTRTTRPGAMAALTGELGPEDWRRADGAMALALDPQGNGAPVAWDNAQSGIKGVFTPVGGPFLRSDEICRAFLGSFGLQTGVRRLQGTACRPSGGEWVVKDSEIWKGA